MLFFFFLTFYHAHFTLFLCLFDYWAALSILSAYLMSTATKHPHLCFWEYFTKFPLKSLLPYCLSLVSWD